MNNVTVTLPEYEYKKLVEFKDKIEKHKIYITRPASWYSNDEEYEFMGVDYALKKLIETHEEYSKSYIDNMSSENEGLKSEIKQHELKIKEIANLHYKIISNKDKQIRLLTDTLETLKKKAEDRLTQLNKPWWKLW